jgi:hypothetical protein
MAEVHQRFAFHPPDSGGLIEVHQTDDTAWININAFTNAQYIAGPEITVFFDRGLAGRDQIVSLIATLERVAANLLRDFEDSIEVTGRV